MSGTVIPSWEARALPSWRRPVLTVAALVAAVGLGVAACGSPASEQSALLNPTQAAITLTPQVEDNVVTALTVDLGTPDNERPALVDTGSPYAIFNAPALGDPNTSCSPPLVFYYGSSTTPDFCPLQADLTIATNAGSQPLTSGPLIVGSTEGWSLGAIFGLTGNLDATANRTGMRSVIEQIEISALAFEFPSGPSDTGTLRFGSYDGGGAIAAAINLTDPGALDYGYVAELESLEYLAGSDVVATLSATSDGVIYSTGGTQSRVANSLTTFFDTGTTVPSIPINGDDSLMGSQTRSMILKNPSDTSDGTGTQPTFDGLRARFTGTDGQPVTLASSNWSALIKAAPESFDIPAASEFPADLDQLVIVTGLNFLMGYGLEFTFSDGVAEQARFYAR